MNINRHNYEEFFVLYWDDELAAEQKKQVENFVQANTDLQEEFRLFGETRFSPDAAILFNEKEFLLNEKNSFINFSNYPERLLSYIDDELNSVEKNIFEIFVEQHPTVKKELSVLLKTKFQPEAEIIFTDKSVLYRREEKVKVIGIYWRRLAVAAIILLMAGLVTFRVVNNNKKDGKPDFVNINTPVIKKEIPINPDGVLPKQDQKLPEQKQVEDKKLKQPLLENLPDENSVVIKNTENKNNLPKEKNNVDKSLIANNSTTNQTEETGFTEIEKANNSDAAIAQVEKKDPLFNNSTVTNKTSPTLAKYDPDEGSVPVKEKEDKGGLKGLLRKATRVFEHHTNIKTTTDDNKLLVGVFAVSLK